jgi:hypothetical protein
MEVVMTGFGNIYATWTDPLGQEWQLTNTSPDVGWFTTFGIAGWGATPYEIVTDPLTRGGTRVRYVRAESGRLTWPLHIWGESHLEFVDRWRTIKRAFMMTMHRREPGVLRVARPDGTAREIECFYEEGFAGEAGQGWRSIDAALTLFCPDGYWRDVAATQVLRSYGVGQSYLNPYPQVSSSQVLGETQVANSGDVDAWPVWTITGPATAVTATNQLTGRSFILTHTLTTGQQITITTMQPTVRGPSDENLISALNWPLAYLWPLLPGVNDIEILVTGAGAGTAIEMSFHARHEGA